MSLISNAYLLKTLSTASVLTRATQNIIQTISNQEYYCGIKIYFVPVNENYNFDLNDKPSE